MEASRFVGSSGEVMKEWDLELYERRISVGRPVLSDVARAQAMGRASKDKVHRVFRMDVMSRHCSSTNAPFKGYLGGLALGRTEWPVVRSLAWPPFQSR